jgi:hypothetical protein
MLMNDDDREVENLMCDEVAPSPAKLTNDDDDAKADVIRYAEELERAVREFRAAHNVPKSCFVMIRKNPNGGLPIMEAIADPFDGLNAICENSKAAAAMRTEFEEEEGW